MVAYFILVFFEYPFWCYKDGNVDCANDVIIIGIPFLNHNIFRIIEITLLLLIASERLIKYSITKKSKVKFIRFIVISIVITGCLIDMIINLILIRFPYFNFVARGFLILFLNRTLREEWRKIITVLWSSKFIFFILVINWTVFSLIGYLILNIYRINNDFSDYKRSFETMFLLLTTCNFPDVMIEFLDESKLIILFFVPYLIINAIFILSLLKSLCYFKYFELRKNQAENYLNSLMTDKVNSNDLQTTQTIENKDKEKSLNLSFISQNIEHDNIDRAINQNIKNTYFDDDYNDERKKTRIYELVMNLILISSIILIMFKDNFYKEQIIPLYQIMVSLIFLIEFFIQLHRNGFKIMFRSYFKLIFFLVNIYVIVSHFLILILIIEKETTELLVNIGMVLRIIRIKNLLETFDEFILIFDIFEHLKISFIPLLCSLLSFFYIFSSITMLIVGGKIKKNSFDSNIGIVVIYFRNPKIL